MSTVIQAKPKTAALGGKAQPAPSMLWVWRTLLTAASEEVRRSALGDLPLLMWFGLLYLQCSQFYYSRAHHPMSSIQLASLVMQLPTLRIKPS